MPREGFGPVNLTKRQSLMHEFVQAIERDDVEYAAFEAWVQVVSLVRCQI